MECIMVQVVLVFYLKAWFMFFFEVEMEFVVVEYFCDWV